MSHPPGTRLGAYEVTGLLGVGGMGEVYRARDTRLGRDVAIKAILPTVAADPDRLARFTREAQVLASLNHPNIAHIHGLEPADTGAGPFLVLELVDGPTLADRIARGPMPLDEALPIATQITEALEAAHDAGVVHRDLKPANIKVRPDGTVKVLDFGLAKALDPSATAAAGAPGAMGAGAAGALGALANSPTITSPALTTRGVILGTAAYMAPEQAKGRPVDHRADIWSFGCVLYEMLTGVRPFDGEDITDILGAIVKTEPDWSRLPAGTPAALRRLLARCLVKDARKRLQRIGDARLELADAGVEPNVTSSGTTGAGRAPGVHLAWAAGAIAIAVASGFAFSAYPRPVPPGELRVDIATPPTFEPSSYAISPDGMSLAFAANEGRVNQLWIRRLDQHSATPLKGTEGATLPFWSPDGRSVGFSRKASSSASISIAGSGSSPTLPRDVAAPGTSAASSCSSRIRRAVR